jgi:hypothetical protein
MLSPKPTNAQNIGRFGRVAQCARWLACRWGAVGLEDDQPGHRRTGLLVLVDDVAHGGHVVGQPPASRVGAPGR